MQRNSNHANFVFMCGSWITRFFLGSLVSGLVCFVGEVRAETPTATEAAPVTVEEVIELPTPTKAPVATQKKGKAPREKETEGTEAPDRFQADAVIKSEYELDGKKLEVDPD